MLDSIKNSVSSANVEKVLYPGLRSHPQHELAKQQMSGFGGMITFYIKGGIDEARTFLETYKIKFHRINENAPFDISGVASFPKIYADCYQFRAIDIGILKCCECLQQ